MSATITDTLDITSPAFVQGGIIPEKYTCDGERPSPQLTISKIPAGTVSLALIIEDPDATKGKFDHWFVWNGIHHYHFKAFALDTRIDLEEGSGKETLLRTIEAHILARGELVGMYGSSKPKH